MKSTSMKQYLKNTFLCLLALTLNIALSFLSSFLPISLFLDSIFTVALIFYCGLVPALVVAAFYNPLMTLIRCAIYGTEIFYFDFLYALCGILIVIITWALSRNKKEFFFSKTVTVLYLFIIVFASSFVSSFMASILDTYIRPLFEKTSGFSSIDKYSLAFQQLKFDTFLSYLLPRIPITVLDRLICTFAGFGIYRLAKRRFS